MYPLAHPPLCFSLTLPTFQFYLQLLLTAELPLPQLTQLGSVLVLGSSFTHWDLFSFSHTCSRIERWLCHSQRKLFGAFSLASLLIQGQYSLPRAGWKESCHCPSQNKLGSWGFFSSSVTLCPTGSWACVLAGS